jgi:hypothetical protein
MQYRAAHADASVAEEEDDFDQRRIG